MKNSTKSMTEGSPAKLIIGFAIPMLMGLLFQQLYNMADTAIVGKWLGVKELAAVGSVGSLNFMIIGFCLGVCSGFAIPVAQFFGAEDYKALRKCVANSVWLSAIFSLVMTVVVCVLCRPILELMRTPEDIIDDAYKYIFIIFLGIPVTYLYNVLAGIIRSLGDSRTPVVFLIISSVLNVVLDIVFVTVFKEELGVAGPAIATVVSQLTSGVLCLFYMIKKFPILHIEKDEWKLDKKLIKKLVGNGLPMGLQYSITAIGSVTLQSAVNDLGSNVVAAVTAGGKINMFFICPFDALAGTMATFAGQNIGAKKPKRIKRGIISSIIIASIYAVCAFVVLYFFSQKIALLFLDATEVAILANVKQFIFYNSLFYVPVAILLIMRMTVQGMGYSDVAVIAGIIEMVVRVVLSFGLVPKYGFNAVCLANPLSWSSAAIFLSFVFVWALKRKIRKLEKE